MIKRIAWKNDSYMASEKQIAFIESLLQEIQTQMVCGAAGSLVDLGDTMQKSIYDFWMAAKLPDSVTKTEAAGLIDSLKFLRSHPASSRGSMLSIAMIAMNLAKGSRVNSQTPNVMIGSVFAESLNNTVINALKSIGKLS